jgi:hypothetical protein
VQTCVYCDLENPSDDHLSSHRMSECCEKPLAAREFYRKDHLRQHLRQVHKVDKFTKAMEGWKSKLIEIRSRCGFCDKVFQLWSERNDHLAEHFRNGTSMKDWKGARGLEPAVATLVRHSIPPYLIGTETTSMIPFSAERGNLQQPMSSKPHFPHTSATPTSFEYLVSELGKFTMAQKTQDLVPTDQMLQEKARLIVYGDNDPWNQTAADNSQWLELFKQGYGIVDPALSNTGQTELAAYIAQDSHLPETLDLPWYWQSPECLAIYRQNKASFYAHHNVNPPDVLGAPEALPRTTDLSNLTTSGPTDFNLNEHEYEQGISLWPTGDDDWYSMENLTQHPPDHPEQFNHDSGNPQSLVGLNAWSDLQSTSIWDGCDIFPSDFELEMQNSFG